MTSHSQENIKRFSTVPNRSEDCSSSKDFVEGSKAAQADNVKSFVSGLLSAVVLGLAARKRR